MLEKNFNFKVPVSDFGEGSIRLTDSIFKDHPHTKVEFLRFGKEKPSINPHYLFILSNFIQLQNGTRLEIKRKYLIDLLQAKFLITNQFENCYSNESAQITEYQE